MEEEFMALNFVKNNPFFKKDAEKRMSASFCGSLSLVSDTVVVPDPVIRRPVVKAGYRAMGVLSSSRSKSAFSLADNSRPETMDVEGTTVRLRRTDSTRRKEMAARRETVEILMEEIVRENRKSVAEVEAEENAASSGSDLEYGPGIVEKLKAKFGRISGGERRRRNHKRHHSVDDILEEPLGLEYGTYERKQSRQYPLTVPERSTQTLDRSPRHSNGSNELSRRASRSMADLGTEDYSERRAFSLQRPSRREEYERQQEERLGARLSIEEDDMVDIRELRKMFDRPVEGAVAPAPWRSAASRERFIERGRTHQTVPPNLGDSRRDAPPPRELRLSSAPTMGADLEGGEQREYPATRAVPLKKTPQPQPRRVSESQGAAARAEEDSSSEPEFVRMARRLRRATVDSLGLGGGEGGQAGHEEQKEEGPTKPLLIATTASPPADPAPQSDIRLASPPAGRRDSFTGAPSDVSPPPEEPKPPMRPPSSSEVGDLLSEAGSRYSSLARSEKSDRSEYGRSDLSRTDSTHVPYSDASLPRSDFSTASKVSKRSVSTEGGVRMGYGSRSTSQERNTYKRIVPENQEASGVAEMQRLLSKFSARKPRSEEEEREKEAPHADAQPLLAAREARSEEREEEGGKRSGSYDMQQLQHVQQEKVLSPEPERRRFVPTVVGVRSSDGRQLLSPTMTTTPIGAELLHAGAPAANVVSISVRESTPSVIYTNNRSCSRGSYDLQQAQHHRQLCDEDDSDVRRSSVGSTASSTVSTESMAESLTSSGCSSSEDLAASTEDTRPRSLAPPATPPRRESLESSSPTSRKSLTARYLEERGREITVAAPEEESVFEMSAYHNNSTYNSSKPYGDEACTPVPVAAAAEDSAAAAPTTTVPKVEEAAASAACNTPHAPASSEEEEQGLTRDVSIVEIEEEEIIEEEADETMTTSEARQQQSVDEESQEEDVEEPTPETRPHPEEDSDSEVDTDDDGEIEDIANRHLRLCLEDMNSPLMAGDGNPIRHSLIHLAMEEDRPALLEAMSETYSFVFEDLESGASTSAGPGIISAPHKERRAKMKRISIAPETVAGVYTYLDEQSAESEDHWREGAAVTIEDYHSMVAAAAAEAEAAYMRNMDELARWKASIAATEGSSSSDPMADLNSRHLVFST